MLNRDKGKTIIREAPVGTSEWQDDETRVVINEEEKKIVLDVGNIQGNIIDGFNKDYQTMVFLRLEDEGLKDLLPFRLWLSQVTPQVATTDEVLAFNALFKQMRKRRGGEGFLKSTWINIAFSHRLLRVLTQGDPKGYDWETLKDDAFEAGMQARAVKELGDPEDPAHPGHPSNWLFGGPHNEADVVLIVASDEPDDLNDCIKALLLHLPKSLAVVTSVEGETLRGDLKGHEHFGFLDGVSQPGIRGRASEDPFDVLTRRHKPKEAPGQGKPGQDLVWPGEFVLGYPGEPVPPLRDHAERRGPELTPEQKLREELEKRPGPSAVPEDHWMADGSFLVVRRLRQEVEKFNAFLEARSRELSSVAPISAHQLGAMLVGRWKSGAPILKAPEKDDADLGAKDLENNDFEFAGDAHGKVCPFAAHIRKTYTRDDSGRADISEEHAQTRRLLRRGIPFTTEKDRGLLFASYQTSIADQFEFIQKSANDPSFKSDGAGHDLIIGQTNAGGSRRRSAKIYWNGEQNVVADEDFVIPTGGGYFFAPSRKTLERFSKGE